AELLGNAYVAPRDATEQALAEVWSQVLGVARVGVHDNFFELGGDSIISIQMASRTGRALGVQVSPRALFEAPTVAELAAYLAPEHGQEQGQEQKQQQTAPVIQPVPRDGALPMSFGQQRLWFLEDFNPGGTDYHSAAGLRLTGALDAAALRAAVTGLMDRHEALRTTFDIVDGRGVQVVHDAMEPEWTAADLTDLTDADARAERLRELVRADVARPYDLKTGPLVRVLLVRLAADDHVCVLGMHHIVTDGWSMGVVSHELGELYAAHVQGRSARLPEVAVQYPDFAAWQRARLEDGGLLEQQLDWWRERLAGVAPLELPTDRSRPTVRTSVGAVYGFEVPEATVTGLKSLAGGQGATLFMALTAAVKAVFARYTGQEDIAVGTASSGRGQGDLEGLVGFLVNTVVLRSQVDPQASFRTLLGQVRQTVLEAFGHEDVPFERLVEAMDLERDTSRTPLIQAMVVLQNAPAIDLSLGDVTASDYPLERETALFDLTIEFEEHNGGLRALIEYSAELFDETTIARLGDHLNMLLAASVADADRALAELPMLTDAEVEQVVREFNATGGVAPEAGCIHERVAERAALTPDALAVTYGDQSLTYRELDERANQLAHCLGDVGATPEALIGLSVERSTEMVVALLGIMKAGAAYVPLDPAYPADRLAYMLQDSGAKLLVTHRGLQDGQPAEGVTVIDLDRERERIAQLPVTAPEVAV
ncbi:peptide synthetase, partial [Streptomyces sp. NBRC 110611]|uniref:condensation domain-containing protein n=1 Tax=Streptomyces sp. NBRC 110611 TaxID=1621259 RepID=UPI0008574B9B